VHLVSVADGIAVQEQLDPAEGNVEYPGGGVGVVGSEEKGAEHILRSKVPSGGVDAAGGGRRLPDGGHVLGLARSEGKDGPLRGLLHAGVLPPGFRSEITQILFYSCYEVHYYS